MKPISIPTLLLCGASALLASSLTVALQAQAKPDPKSILDRIYSVAQAQRGEARFKQSCASCHTTQSFADGAFADRWSGQSMAEVFEWVSANMPDNDPGGLKKEDYADVLAYILGMNAYPVGAADMPADRETLKQYEIVPNPK
jgi:mono/diheme cytochrome c family protein